MLWFRHRNDLRRDPRLRLAERQLGEGGYARALKLAELVCADGDRGTSFRLSLKANQYGVAWLTDELGLRNEAELEKTLSVLARAGWIDSKSLKRREISMPWLVELRDEWARKKQRRRKKESRRASSTGSLRSSSAGPPEGLRSDFRAAPEQLRPESESDQNQKKSQRKKQNRHPDDSVPRSVCEQLCGDFPEASPARLLWGVRLVLGRAKRPVGNAAAFCRKALPAVFEDLEAEVRSWLVGVALGRLAEDGDALRLPDLSEELKVACAENDLPYHGEMVDAAVDAALRRLQNERQAQAELRVGRLA